MDLLKELQQKAKKKNAKVIFPESTDSRVLKAVAYLSSKKILQPILIGDPKKIRNIAKKEKVSLKNIQIIVVDETHTEDFYIMRKRKGLTRKQAKKIMKQPIYYGVMMLKKDLADGLVAGATHPTSDTLRPAFQILKTNTKASSHFLMFGKFGAMLFADCAVIPDPDSRELAEITLLTTENAKFYGVNPKVALLSFSTKGSGKHDSSEKVRKATAIVRKKSPELIIDGEMQLDAAICKRVASIKNPESKLKGDANVLIFPNLDAGNIGYKLVQYFGGAKAIGPIIQGLEKPVNDLSRGCVEKDIIAVAVITALQKK